MHLGICFVLLCLYRNIHATCYRVKTLLQGAKVLVYGRRYIQYTSSDVSHAFGHFQEYAGRVNMVQTSRGMDNSLLRRGAADAEACVRFPATRMQGNKCSIMCSGDVCCRLRERSSWRWKARAGLRQRCVACKLSCFI